MRKLRYNVAVSLDGFIATPNGGYDWIVDEPGIDFTALFAEFDLFVMGRKTYEVMLSQGVNDPTIDKQVVVASRTLISTGRPNVTIIRDDVAKLVAEFKSQQGKDIWLFGGGQLARQLLDARLVDNIEVGIMPVLLSEGIPLLPVGHRVRLKLNSSKSYPSGIMMLNYSVDYGS